MPLHFNSLLVENGLDPTQVRLIRHKDKRAKKGRSIYELWRNYSELFEVYQSTQRIKNHNILNAPYWAVFVVTPAQETMFAGVYGVKYKGLLEKDTLQPHNDEIDKAGEVDCYHLEMSSKMQEMEGKLFIDWGKGERSWIQYADRQNKPVVELKRKFEEPPFPGHLNFIESLSSMERLPITWIEILKNSKGVYLLTCPRTKEQYVGSAYGSEGFWHRWHEYMTNGHGGNIQLKSRDASDYQVSILEVAGSSASNDEIIAMESLWKRKLMSREMGLNKN